MPTPVIKQDQFNFKTALDKVLEGKKVTKLEWHNDHYGFMRAEILHIHREGKDNVWSLSTGDISGEDYVVVE